MMKVAPLRGLNTGWMESGSGDSILFLIHGFPDDAMAWKEQISFFENKMRVVAPYLRGVATSEASNEMARYNPDSVALDHLDILRQVDPKGLGRIWIAGHDIGAAHAWKLAQLLGSRLAGLVIINGASNDQMLERLMRHPRHWLKSWYMGFFMMPFVPQWTWRKLGAKILKRQTALHSDNMIQHYRTLALDSLKQGFHKRQKLEKPVLLIHSLSDPYLDPPSEGDVQKLTDEYTIRVIKGGHWVHQEQPKKINALIDQFIGEHA